MYNISYKNIGKNRISRIIIDNILGIWDIFAEMIIPKTIGILSKGVSEHFMNRKLLADGHRFRSDSVNF